MASTSTHHAPSRSAPYSSAFSSRPRVLLLVWCLVAALQLASAAMVPIPAPRLPSSYPSPTSYPPTQAESLEAAKLAQVQRRGLAWAESTSQVRRRNVALEGPEASPELLKRAATTKKKTTSSTKKKTTSSTKKKTTSSTKKKTSTSTKKKTSSTKKTTSSSTKKTTSSTKKATSTTSSKKTTTSSSKSTSSTTTTTTSTASPSTPTLASSKLHLLVQNNLDWATLDEHPSFLLSETPSTYTTASVACAGLSETLASPSSANVDLQKQLSYLIYKGVLSSGQSIWTSDSQLLTLTGTDGSYTLATSSSKTAKYAVLCTQSAPRRTAYTTDTSSDWDVRVKTPAGSIVTGYRDGLSFRFHAIPYASTPLRFQYSTVDTSARVIDATVSGTSKQCPQRSGAYTEDCLVLSIWTTYLPSASANSSSLVGGVAISNSTISSSSSTTTTPTSTETTGATDTNGAPAETATTSTTDSTADSSLGSRHVIEARATDKSLRPIMVWVHGGGGVAGTGLDPTFDGGQLASRGDVIIVNINYRLGTLGALPISDTLTGNYGLQDIVTALKWLKTNAATFGGDASQITLFGQSSGANLIQILLGNPSASGLFHKVILQSGRPADSYNGALAADTSETKAAATISALGCTKSTVASTLACLRALPVSSFLSTTVYSQTTVDDDHVPQRAYALNGRGDTTNSVPVLMGFMRDEMAALGYVPPRTMVNLNTAMTNAGIVKRTRQIVIDNPDVFPQSIPNGIQNLTVSVESYNGTGSRCGTPATAYAALRSAAFSDIWVYTQDQRAYQIPNYDPNKVCQPTDESQAGNSSAYYFCHSGDLLSTFATPMYEFGMGDRDGQDLDWIRNVVDQWTAFARSSNPNPTKAYRSARGYSAVQGDPWPKLDTSSGAAASRMISLGPTQMDVPLVYSPAQCNNLGNGIKYIYKGGETGDDDGS